MQKYVFVLLLILVAGCTNPTKLNKAKARYLCKEYGEVIRWVAASRYPVTCADGTKISVDTINSTIIPKDYLEEVYSE